MSFLNADRRWFRAVLTLSLFVAAVSTGRWALAEEDFSEPDAEDFAYPVPWLKSGPVKERMYFASSRNQLLKRGWEDSPARAVSAAREDYEAARKRCPDDPRLDYAYGLALWRNERRPEAIKQFDLAARLTGTRPPFLPAAQAAAWSRFLEGEREAGMNQVLLVATVLSKSKGDYPTRVQKEDSALFLGRAVGFLSDPGSVPATAEADQRRLDEVASLIPEDLKDEFELGREQIDERHAELTALASRPAAEIEAEFAQKRGEVQKELESFRSEIAKFNEDLESRGDDQRKWLKDQTQQIGKLSRELPQLQSRLQSAARAVVQFQNPEKHYEYQEVRVRKEDKDGKFKGYETERRKVERPETTSERSERLSKLSAAQSAGNALLQRREMVVAEMERLQDERRQSNVDFQKGQKELRTARSKLFAKHRTCAVKLKQVEQDYVSPEDLKTRVNTIAPYVPWDVDVERDGLLASYKISLPETNTP